MVSKINLIELATGQAGKEILINENLARLESFCFPVLSIANTPPANPADLDSYIVGSTPTGLWTGYANYWVCFVNGGWVLAPPSSRMFLFDVSSNSFYNWNGTTWVVVPVGSTFSGSYNDLTDTPTLFSGSYNDLTDTPTLFSGSYNDLTDTPTLFSGSYNDLTDTPTLFSGSYNDLTDTPTLFSGSYNDLTENNSRFFIGIPNSSNPVVTSDTFGRNYVFNSLTDATLEFFLSFYLPNGTLPSFWIINKSASATLTLVSTNLDTVFPLGDKIPPNHKAFIYKDGWDIYVYLQFYGVSKGDLIVGASDTQLGVSDVISLGNDGQILTVDSTAPNGIAWKSPTSGVTSPLTTKGDIWSYSTTDARLGVGSDGQVLKANNATATGLQWGAIAYSEVTGTPTLGTAAALNVGTSANNVVQLDGSAKLPAVDGSQLTNLPVGGVPYQTFKTNQTSNYTIQQSDHGTWIPCATNNLTITLPDGLTSGTQVILDRRGTATVTVTASTTLIGKNVSANSVQIANQYGVVHCVHQGSNIWRITGDL